MKTGQKIRHFGFTGFDLLQGGKTRHHLNDLKRHFADPTGSRVLEGERLNRLLRHACKTVPFYKNYSGYDSIYSFPVIEKTTIKKIMAAFYHQLTRKVP